MPYTFRQGDLPKLDLEVDKGSDFKAWNAQWRAYKTLSGLSGEDATKQADVLRLCLSRDTLTTVDNLGLTKEQEDDPDAIVEALRRHVEGQINVTVERRNFRKRKQQLGETFDDFLCSLRELAKTCQFCNDACTQHNIRDQIIEGLTDSETVQELIKVQRLTLPDTVTTCRGMEAAKKEVTNIKGTSVQKINHRRNGARNGTARKQKQPSPTKENTTQNSSPQSQSKCKGCGRDSHEGGRRNCPAKDLVCHSCGQKGHIRPACYSKSKDNDNKGSGASVNALEFNKNDRLWSINAVAAEPPAPTVALHAKALNGEADVQVLPDSGANICAAGVQFLTKLGELEDNIGDSDVEPQTVNGKTMKPLGCLRVTFSTPDRTTEEIVHIYPGIKGALISWKAAVRLGFLPECYPTPLTNQTLAKISATDKVTREDLIAEFPKVFEGVIRTMPGEKFKIVLSDDAKPFCVHTPRTIPFPFREKLRELLDALLDAGIIASQTEPTDWCAPIVVVLKKDGENLRLCVDLSKLNKYVKRERYQSMTPALAVADITESCARFFTSLDAVKGYHQCPLDEESQLLTTFITPFGRFKFLRAPFGVSSISEHYDRRMAEAFEGLGQFRRIVDDTLIYDADETQHIEHVRQFLRRCEEKGISLCRDKFRFCQREIDFAGFRVTQGGYQINPEITKAITEFPTPSSRTDLRSFLGLVNQISGTSAEISKATTPLRPLLSTKNDFVWAAPHDEAFGVTKRLLSSAPIMAFYDANKPTRLMTDASRTGIGFVLQQQHGDKWLTIQANSRHLTDTEGRYAVIELEMLAVTWATEKCRVFLAGLPTFLVVTDHNPLVPILNSHRLDEIEKSSSSTSPNEAYGVQLHGQMA